MRISARAAAAAGVALLATAAALAQERPESILPPGFGQPQAEPTRTAPRTPREPSTPRPRTTAAPRPLASASPAAVVAPARPTPSLVLPDLEGPLALPSPTPTPSAQPTLTPAQLAQYEMPSYARRSLASVGFSGPGEGGVAAWGFGRANGPYLEGVMRRIDAPLPSRWLSILLRRTLVSELDTPQGVNGADFAAERAWLLLRMGEAVMARQLVQNVDTGNYTPKLIQVAEQAWLATGDPSGLCPIVPAALQAVPDRGWTLAQGVCAGLGGKPGVAGQLMDQARRHHVASGIDYLLAEKVTGAGARGRRAVTIDWGGVDRLTAWRYGLAMATGVEIPAELYDGVPIRMRYWQALAPTVPAYKRAAAAELAAAQGVLSNLALVDLYSKIDADADDAAVAEIGIARDLRDAYVGERDTRIAALRKLWDEPKDARGKFARLVLTARAAARVQAGSKTPDADRVIASMLTAGMARSAMRWAGAVPRGSDGWAMLALADPDMQLAISAGDVDSFGGQDKSDGKAKTKLLLAALAGLGRLDIDSATKVASGLDFQLGAVTGWTRAIDAAARDDQSATVVLLAALGLQAQTWRGVSPVALYHACAALRAVGKTGDAQMIAAEAIARV